MTSLRMTSRDLQVLPDDSKRYEVIDGELYVSRQPHNYHQLVSSRIWELLQVWSRQTKAGEAINAPGLIFAEDDDVAPDVTWMSRERRATAFQADGKYHAAPELVVEVLSPGTINEQRDRETKLKLYSRRGVLEYWIVGWIEQRLEVYRRDEGVLKLHGTFYKNDLLQSPHLPGFACRVGQFFDDIF